jgi:hypothetical protein
MASALRTDPRCFRLLAAADPVVIELREWSESSLSMPRRIGSSRPPIPLILRRIRIDHQVKLLRGAMLDRDGVLLRRALCFRLRP